MAADAVDPELFDRALAEAVEEGGGAACGLWALSEGGDHPSEEQNPTCVGGYSADGGRLKRRWCERGRFSRGLRREWQGGR